MLEKAHDTTARYAVSDQYAFGRNTLEARTPENAPEANALGQYFCNSKNTFPVRVLYSVATAAPGSQYPRILLFGKSGLGKSHLIKAMAALLQDSQPRDSISLCMDGASNALAQPQCADPRLFWQKHNVLILDDIQQLVGDTAAQDRLVSLLESCPANCQIIMALSGDDTDLKHFLPRLATRLSECLALNLLEPDLDVRMRYMEHEAANMDLEIDHQIVIYVAQRCPDIPSVRGILQKIRAFTAVHRRNLIHNDIANIIHSGKTVDIPEYLEIINRVSKSLGVKPEEVLGDERRQPLVQARQISMYICRTSLGLSYQELGRAFGGKDHSTVVHAVNKIRKMMESDRKMNNLVTQLASSAA